MQKLKGYLLSGVGLFILALSITPVYTKIEIIQKIPANFLMIAGIILAILGVALTSRGGKVKEVPIYHGKNIVGYRRV